LRNLAGKLGYSAMTLSNVSVELRATGLCEDSPDGRKRGLAFRFDGNDLWTRAKPLLSSPVIKKIWVRTESCSFPLAGMSALSEYTMINDDNWVTFACRNTRLKKLIKDGRISALQDPENATGLLEVWKYDPDILANNGRVDRLSLYLSMEDRPDERVRSSLDHLLEDMTW
jgi:hypothetical protein